MARDGEYQKQSSRDGLSTSNRQLGDGGDYYYQHDTEAAATTTNNNYNNWALSDFGVVGERSRDGSIHATDEVFNAASHLAATMLSILGTVLLISESSSAMQVPANEHNDDNDGTTTTKLLSPDPWKIVSFSIYGASLVFLFACSTLHHALSGPLEEFLRMMDYLAIYPLIGGTFTPLCLVFYHDQVIGWAFCATVWSIAILGMIATACCFSKIPKWLSMTMYITLGWLGACMTYWLVAALGWRWFWTLSVGGYLLHGRRLRLHHGAAQSDTWTLWVPRDLACGRHFGRGDALVPHVCLCVTGGYRNDHNAT